MVQAGAYLLVAWVLLSSTVYALASTEDVDEDGMSDDFEGFFGLDPFSAQDALEDLDQDGLHNLLESKQWTDPFHADTDRDGWLDGQDADPLSRVVIRWGHPQFVTGDTYHYPGPPWWVDATKIGGQWMESAWSTGAETEPGVGRLWIRLESRWLDADLNLELDVTEVPGASLYLDLLNEKLRPVATDLFGNLLGRGQTRRQLRLKLRFLRFQQPQLFNSDAERVKS